ncbi:hypothetical protein [Plantactinospora sp. CA-290183]|uniref:hypothetical protein n=1 Tax=Plantactinospora sp. CA-290183 TaxID=3240006 RepID=UPI003D8E504C
MSDRIDRLAPGGAGSGARRAAAGPRHATAGAVVRGTSRTSRAPGRHADRREAA